MFFSEQIFVKPGEGKRSFFGSCPELLSKPSRVKKFGKKVI